LSRVGVTTGQLFSTLPAARDWRDACWQKVLRSRLLTSGHHPNPDGASVSSRMTRAPNDCATRRFGPSATKGSASGVPPGGRSRRPG